jgi:hypothetical protein
MALIFFFRIGRFETRSDFATFPLLGDFPIAQKLINNLFRASGPPHHRMVYEDAIIPIKSIWNTRTVNALPETFEEALVAQEYDIGMVYQPNATRSIEWLEENGKCIDHIYPGQSTIDGAGHGAFAKRDLLKGTIISGSPLLHVPFNNAFMPMYRIHTHEETVYVDTREVVSQQLILNYCFGHSETPLLLCPCKYGVSSHILAYYDHYVS